MIDLEKSLELDLEQPIGRTRTISISLVTVPHDAESHLDR
jgi:hypothetical protein